MAQTDAQLRATKKYQAKFEELRVRVAPEEKLLVQEHASAQKESVASFLRRAIFDTIARDKNSD